MTEAVAQRCSVKNVFLEISHTCARASFLIALQASAQISNISQVTLHEYQLQIIGTAIRWNEVLQKC